MTLTNLSQVTTSGISTLADINLNNLTGVAATFTGNVTIGGTLTYDDVTNIDSVGLITARSGVQVKTGTATTALIVEGDARITGILSVGQGTITLDSSQNMLKLGATTMHQDSSTGDTILMKDGAYNPFRASKFLIDAVEVIDNTRLGKFTKIGIGITNPVTKLTVKAGSGDQLQLDNAGERYTQISLRNSGTQKAAIWLDETNDDLSLYAAANYDIRFLNGTESARITSAGDMGLGTVSPNTYNNYNTLTINGTNGSEIDFEANGTLIGDILGNASGLFMQTRTQDPIVFSTNNGSNTLERLRITSTGALNIGKGDESDAVENLVELYVGGNNTSHATIRGKYNRTNEFNRSEVRFGVQDNSGGRGFLAFATGTNSASERMRITYDGNVGINTENPTAPLTVMSSSDPEIKFGYKESQSHTITWDSSKLFLNADPGNANGNSAMGFRVDGTERLRIKSGGNVGIGTDNPGQLLHLFNASPRILLTETTNNSNCYLDYASPGVLEISVDDNNVDANSKFQVRIDGATAALTLDSSECLRIGNTHSQTTSGNTKRIALGAKASIWGWTSGNINGALTLADNYYWDGANNRAIEADEAAYLTLRSGTLRFGTTDSTPSAGGVTGLTEKIHINSAGSVGINCTPLAKLQVKAGTNANIAFTTMSSEAAIETFNDAGSANVPLRFRASEHKFFIGSAEKLRITSDGKLGINATNPGGQLCVSDASTYTVNVGPNGGAGALVSTLGGSASLALGTDSTERLRILGGGGIEFRDATGAYLKPLLDLYNTNTGAYGGAIQFSGTGSSGKYIQARIRAYGGTGVSGQGLLAIETGGAERLRIDNLGKLGINASAFPQYSDRLVVQGNTSNSVKAMICVRGGDSGYIHSGIRLHATNQNNNGNGRGTGVFYYDEVSDVEWFAGRPYSSSDYFTICRNYDITDANAGGVTAQHGRALWFVDNTGATRQKKEQCIYRAETGSHKSSRVHTVQGKNGTFSTITVDFGQGSYGSVAYDIKVGAYSAAHYHRAGTYYCNGALYSNYTSINNSSGNISHTQAYTSGQTVRHTFAYTNGFVHPVVEVTASCGGDGYFVEGSITISIS